MSVSQPARYNGIAVFFHWIIGVALLGQITFGWLLSEFARGTPQKAMAVNLHKSTGLILAVLILARLIWRLRHQPPSYPESTTAYQVRAIRVGHALLYLCMIGLPLTGYLASNFSRHGINFLNLYPLPPWGPDDKVIYSLLNGAHDALAIAFSVLVAGHILLALYHAFVARDGLSARMRLVA